MVVWVLTCTTFYCRSNMQRFGTNSKYLMSLGIGLWLSWQGNAAATKQHSLSSAHSMPLTFQSAPQYQRRSLQLPFRVADLFFPPMNQKPILRVIGKGRAAQPADTAQMVFEFSLSETPTPDDTPELPPEPDSFQRKRHLRKPQRYKATTGNPDQSKLQPVTDALKKIGVAESDMSVKSREAKGSSPFPFPFPSKVTSSGLELSVKQNKPTQARLQELAKTVETAAEQLDSLSLNRTGVTYTVNDCRGLETQVYRSAGEDAMQRATAIASAMGAKLNPVPSVAQPIYDLIYPACRSDRPFPFNDNDTDFKPDSVPEVVLTREIFVTFTLKRK
jgi:hypothetical protein